jgi:hypothetical protein
VGEQVGDCNRNGVLVNGKCVCDAAWKNGDCSTLALLPAKAENLGAIYPNATTSSWGGTITYGEDNLYHFIVSEMADHCGLGTVLSILNRLVPSLLGLKPNNKCN